MAAAPPGALRVVVAYCPGPGRADVTELALPPGATVRDALAASALAARHPGLELTDERVGVWGERRALDSALRDGDRVEVYRPLQVDPKEARRRRQREARASRGGGSGGR